MKKSQIKALEQLIADENVKGKNYLNYVLWLNTSQPKFKIGDCFKVTDRGHSICGYPIKNFNAKIIKIKPSAFLRKDWDYTFELIVRHNGKEHIVTVYKLESDLMNQERCADNINILDEANT